MLGLGSGFDIGLDSSVGIGCWCRGRIIIQKLGLVPVQKSGHESRVGVGSKFWMLGPGSDLRWGSGPDFRSRVLGRDQIAVRKSSLGFDIGSRFMY